MDAERRDGSSDRYELRQPRVLVVDDDPGIRLVCRAWLAAGGYEVLEAANGQDALELALQGAADVLVLDISMPVLDGFGLAAALQGDERTRSLPFVFLSGETGPDVAWRCVAAGAAAFFGKPFDPAALEAALARLVRGRRLRHAG